MTNMNLDELTSEELKQKYKDTEDLINQFFNQEQSVKRILNLPDDPSVDGR